MKPHAAVFLLFCAFPFVVALLVGTPLMAVLPWVVASAFEVAALGTYAAINPDTPRSPWGRVLEGLAVVAAASASAGFWLAALATAAGW